VSFDRIIISPIGPRVGDRDRVIDRARQRGARAFVLQLPSRRKAERGEEWFRLRSGLIQRLGPGAEDPPVPLRTVRTPQELDRAIGGPDPGRTIALRWVGARMIPLEAAIARRPRPGAVWTVTNRVEEVPGALGALESGAARVIVEIDRAEGVDRLEDLLGPRSGRPLAWCRAVVRTVAPAGVSDRVIVDTTSLLDAREGLLVGSSARLLFHVASEAIGSEFSRPRPFRVNAGSPHSYVLLPDGSTRYLSELEAGDPVLATRPGEAGRAVRVGRLKIERRPMVVVTGEHRHHRGTVFLQEAETVRLSTERGAVATTGIRPDARIWAVTLPPGRHLGTVVEETVVER